MFLYILCYITRSRFSLFQSNCEIVDMKITPGSARSGVSDVTLHLKNLILARKIFKAFNNGKKKLKKGNTNLYKLFKRTQVKCAALGLDSVKA